MTEQKNELTTNLELEHKNSDLMILNSHLDKWDDKVKKKRAGKQQKDVAQLP